MSEFNTNIIPSLTWNWMKINKDTVSLDFPCNQVLPEIKDISSNIEISTGSFDKTYDFAGGVSNFANPRLDAEENAPDPVNRKPAEKTEAQVHPFDAFVKENCKSPQKIIIKGKTDKPVVLDFSKKAEGFGVAVQNILAKADSEATIIFVYENSSDLIKTNIYIEENAKLHIIKVQLLPQEAFQLDDTAIICEDNAKVHFTQIELGGNHVDSGLHVKLNGYQSGFTANVAYLCKNNQYLDFNHIVDHYGKKTECKMSVNGTLKDNAVKTYRGTIDFKNGCCGAKGNEMEETLLLSPKVVNKSIPVILCDEEDVEGEHGSTIGRLSSDILFYMQTRGIDEKSAEEIMSLAKIRATADLIPDENIRNKIEEYINTNN